MIEIGVPLNAIPELVIVCNVTPTRIIKITR